MKAYQINTGGEKEYVAANSAIQALIWYSGETGFSWNDFNHDDTIEEIVDEQLDVLTVKNVDREPDEDWDEKTFRQFIKDETNDDEPFIIASTAY